MKQDTQIKLRQCKDIMKSVVISPYLVIKMPRNPKSYFFLAFFFLFLLIPFIYSAIIWEEAHPVFVKTCAAASFIMMCFSGISFCLCLLAGFLWGESIISNLYVCAIFTFLIFLPLFALVPFMDSIALWTFYNQYPGVQQRDFSVDALFFVLDNVAECVLFDIPQIFDLRFSQYKLRTFAGKSTTCTMRLAFDFVLLGFLLERAKQFWENRKKNKNSHS